MFVNSDYSDLLKIFNDNVEVKFDALPVVFISRQDLITSQRASGRPQDVLDADLLSQAGDD